MRRGDLCVKWAFVGTLAVTIGGFILKNAVRNRRRATLTILSVAASLFLLVTLLVALREITLPAESLGSALRLVVHNKTAIAHFLPVRQRAVIERIPSVEAVTPFTWFGGTYKNDESATFAQFAIDPKVMAAVTDYMGSLSGDFLLGNVGGVRNVDLLGQTGQALDAQAGYIEIDKTVFRVMTIQIPVIINDMFVQVA